MAITINHQTNDISATSGSMTVDGSSVGADNTKMPLSGGTFTGDVIFVDGENAIFGTGQDFLIGHNTDGLINNLTNGLYIQNYANDQDVIIKTDDGSGGIADYFRADGSTGEALLYHYGSEKLATKSTGVEVTGTLAATSLTGNGDGITVSSSALSGTSPSVNVSAKDTYTLTTSGNTTFTFTGAPSSGDVGTFSLILTAGGTHTITWPSSVDWAGGSAPDAPASGEKNTYTFMTVDGGTTYYGFLAGAAFA